MSCRRPNESVPPPLRRRRRAATKRSPPNLVPALRLPPHPRPRHHPRKVRTRNQPQPEVWIANRRQRDAAARPLLPIPKCVELGIIFELFACFVTYSICIRFRTPLSNQFHQHYHHHHHRMLAMTMGTGKGRTRTATIGTATDTAATMRRKVST